MVADLTVIEESLFDCLLTIKHCKGYSKLVVEQRGIFSVSFSEADQKEDFAVEAQIEDLMIEISCFKVLLLSCFA